MRLSEFLSWGFVTSTEVNEGLQYPRCGGCSNSSDTHPVTPPSHSYNILPSPPVRLEKETETLREAHGMGKEHQGPTRRTDKLVIQSHDCSV